MMKNTVKLMFIFGLTIVMGALFIIVPEIIGDGQVIARENVMLTSDLAIVNSKLADITDEYENQNNELTALQENNATLSSQLASIEASNVRMSISLDDASKELETLKEQLDNDNIDDLLSGKDQEIEALRIQIAALEGTIEVLDRKIYDYKKSGAEKDQEITDLKDTIYDLEEIVEGESGMPYYGTTNGYTLLDWRRYIEPEEVIGTWVIAETIDNPETFEAPGIGYEGMLEQYGNRSNFYYQVEFEANGSATFMVNNYGEDHKEWIDDCVLDDDGAWEYLLKEIEGQTYMLMELKNGDYENGEPHGYFVFVKEE